MRILILLGLLLGSACAQARDPFTLAGVKVEPATAASFTITAAGTEVPVTVIHGSNEGVVLTLTAGVHGDEFPSIFALQRLRAELDPTQLSGTVVLVHLANLSGFHARRIALNPKDEKNLNREFPGAADGTPTEQLAHFFTKEVISVTDYLIDLHSGSAYQTLLPHVYSPVLHDAELDARTLAFARATGLTHIVLYDERPNDRENSISYPNTAQTRGKPALTLEVGHLGQRDEAAIQQVLDSCRNALRHLGIVDEPELPAGEAQLYTKLHGVPSTVTGIFHPRSKVGDVVAKGALLGIVHDYYGEPLAELRAPVAGTLLMLLETPAVTAGETPATLGTK
jgi:uncharacterized protein